MDDAGGMQNERLKAAGRALIREHAIIGGERIPAGVSAFDVDDPSDGSIIGRIPKLDRGQADLAIRVAADAFPAWAATSQHKRAEILRKLAALIDERTEALGALLSLENGKPFDEGKAEIASANSFFKWFAGEAERLSGETLETTNAGHTVLVFKEPIGPAAAITPWNFPAAMVTRKVAPALAAGCTIVLKPARQTPFTAIALAELALEAGLPEGVFNVVTGEDDVIGQALTASPLIRKLSFTGSTPVGRLLMEQSAPTLKKLSMELGGAAPLIVFDDADIDAAVAETIKAKFRNSGQTCVCPNRVYVQRAVFDRYVEALGAAVGALKLGAPFEPGVKVGPLIDAKGLDKVVRHVAAAQDAGARVVTGGNKAERGGLYFQPTVLAGGEDGLFRCEETFGPALPVFAFDTEEEVVAKANASEFGLAAYLFTRDLDRTMRVSRALQTGMVGVNTGLFSNAVSPFGGVKSSGFGREGSVHGIEEYLSIKAVTLALR